jgi:hypothetical protein
MENLGSTLRAYHLIADVSGIITGLLNLTSQKIMEAERINSIANLLSDLTIREAELRRYL